MLKKRLTFFLLFAFNFFTACNPFVEFNTLEEMNTASETATPFSAVLLTPSQPKKEITPADIHSKWDLWSSGVSLLRGANVWQALVLSKVDGVVFKGDGRVGPPFTQEDFYNLASLGANYVVISGPGLFTEKPPYQVDMEVQENLDHLLEMIANADMFATIALRSGPGKAEWSLCCWGEPYYRGYFNDRIWTDSAAQQAWVDMWQYTAERYHDNPIVVGYKLMVEPNASEVLFNISEPEEFHKYYSGSLADWNILYPQIVTGIRKTDSETPILVGSDGYSSINWLPFLKPVNDLYIVYVVHQYSPYEQYTHQDPWGNNSYPDTFDTNNDRKEETFDRNWLINLLLPVSNYFLENNSPIAVDEFGICRWVPGAAEYMYDLMGLFEENSWNYAIWEWATSYRPFEEEVHDFNFRFGSDPKLRFSIENSPLMDVIMYYWSMNIIRPSNVNFVNK